MPIKALRTLACTALVLSYPMLAHWVFPRWHALPGLILLLPPTVLNTWLAYLFGRTLLAGREPMISTFARLERASLSGQAAEALPPELVRYTRNLTKIWSGMLFAMAIVATLLACFGSYTLWAIFTGLISYVLMAMLFLGEYMFRRLRFAHYQHAQPFQAIWLIVKSGPIWMRKQ